MNKISLKKLYLSILNILFKKVKVRKNKIFFINFNGKGYGDNPKYICEWLRKNVSGLDLVWLCDDINNFPTGVRAVRYGTFRAFYEQATAKIWISNIKAFSRVKKKKNQFYLQTWHAGLGLKKCEGDAIETLTPEYIKESQSDSKQIDMMISDCKWLTDYYHKFFWYDGFIAETGLPRNDVFFKNRELIRDKVKKYFEIDENTEIILYAPTFRQYESIEKQIDIYKFNESRVIRAFQHKYHKDFILVKRLHPNISNTIKFRENSIIKNGAFYPDMQELLLGSFALITDFSSSIFDYFLFSNQIYLYAKDYEAYIKYERPLNFDLKKDIPFPFANNEDQLLEIIMNFDDEKANKKIKEFKNKLKLTEDGKASERVSKILLNELQRENL